MLLIPHLDGVSWCKWWILLGLFRTRRAARQPVAEAINKSTLLRVMMSAQLYIQWREWTVCRKTFVSLAQFRFCIYLRFAVKKERHEREGATLLSQHEEDTS